MPNLFDEQSNFEVDPNKNYLEELVGEGKKFSSPEELARGKAESDQFIERLKTEQQQLRDELATRLKYEEFLNKISTLPVGGNQQQPSDDETNQDKSAMSPEQIEQLLDSKLTKLERDRMAQANLNNVRSKLLEVFGPNYAQRLELKGQELGLSKSDIQVFAENNPKALFKLFDMDAVKAGKENIFSAPPRSQINTSGAPMGKAKGWSYYENLRKTNSHEYFQPRVQNEMFSLIQELGEEKFYSQ